MQFSQSLDLVSSQPGELDTGKAWYFLRIPGEPEKSFNF